MQQLFIAWLAFKYGRAIITQMIQLTVLLVFVAGYGLYKLFIYVGFAIKESPIEAGLLLALFFICYFSYPKIKNLLSKLQKPRSSVFKYLWQRTIFQRQKLTKKLTSH